MHNESTLHRLFHHAAAPGIALVAAAAIGMIVANSPAADAYVAGLGQYLGFETSWLSLKKPLKLWINDGLMAVFFLLVGLEIKREVLEGQLSRPSQVLLPAAAAVGGMAAPALLYVAFNMGDPAALRGWAIPAATDIAFALGVLALVASRAPLAMKVFLTTVAVVDDLGAILVIAVFYTETIKLVALGVAAVSLIVLYALNRRGVLRLAPYLAVGLILWVAVLKSGVHATLAGVVLAFFIPLRVDAEHRPLDHLEHTLHPWVSFLVLPVFGFANAGVPLAGITADALVAPVPLGIAVGLVVGKQIGVFGMAAAVVKLGWAEMPEGLTWRRLHALSVVCGIGFTMSLFIGDLAFPDPARAVDVRLGVLGGSLISAVLGAALVRWSVSDTTVDDPDARGVRESDSASSVAAT